MATITNIAHGLALSGISGLATDGTGTWIAVSGNSGDVGRSLDDGGEWLDVGLGESTSLSAIAFHGGDWMAVGDGVLHSADLGTSWNRELASTAGIYFYTVIYAEGIGWLAGGRDSGSNQLVIFRRAGSIWQEEARFGSGTLKGLAQDAGGRLYAAGVGIYSSDDGANWTLREAAAYANGIAARGNRVVSGGSSGQVCVSDDAGVTWGKSQPLAPLTLSDVIDAGIFLGVRGNVIFGDGSPGDWAESTGDTGAFVAGAASASKVLIGGGNALARVDFANTSDPVLADVTVSVEEGAGDGALVAQLQATDADALTGGFVYSIVSGNDAGLFALSADGELTVAGFLDSEAVAQVVLLVEVSDGGPGTARTATGTVTIDITPVNESPPEMGHQVFDVDAATAVAGEVIGQLVASDPDNLPAVITFEIVDGNELAIVSLTPGGELAVAKDLTVDGLTQEDLLVRVSDGELSSEAVVTIRIAQPIPAAPDIFAPAQATNWQGFSAKSDGFAIFDRGELPALLSPGDVISQNGNGWDTRRQTWMVLAYSQEQAGRLWRVGESLGNGFYVSSASASCMGAGNLYQVEVSGKGIDATRPDGVRVSSTMEQQSAEDVNYPGGSAARFQTNQYAPKVTVSRVVVSTKAPTRTVGLEVRSLPSGISVPLRKSVWETLADPLVHWPNGWVHASAECERLTGTRVWLVNDHYEYQFKYSP